MRPRKRGAVSRGLLLVTVFVGGMSGMAIEMAGSRLLAPYFGDSLLVWANLIGLVMIYLTVGYYLGGWLADRYPRPEPLFALILVAALFTALVPWISRPILRYAALGFADFRWGLLASSFMGVVILFAPPMILLGCISPYVIRLDIRGLHATGRVAGGIYALSTLGSILGTFMPVFALVPTIGTRATFWLIAGLLGVIALIGLWQAGSRAWTLALLPLATVGALWATSGISIKPTENLIYEDESAYNYIQVIKQDDTFFLRINEGEANQSIYAPDQVLLNRIFDYFLAAPLFRDVATPTDIERLCIIGLAGGTIAHQYTAVYGLIPIDGVEIDPKIVEVGRRYFGMTMPNLDVYIQDGRYFLWQQEIRYDVIAVDAYKPPYIPFHLSTQEFFAQVRRHLLPQGVVAVNVARPTTDDALVEALASTMKAVFPQVYVVDAPESYNSLLIAVQDPLHISQFHAHAAAVHDPLLRDVAQRTGAHLQAFGEATTAPLRDDRAPVERIIHGMLWRFAQSS